MSIVDPKCQSAVLPAVEGCEALLLVVLDTDDGWNVFIKDLASGDWEKQIDAPGGDLLDVSTTSSPTEEGAKRLVVQRAMSHRAETLDDVEFRERLERYHKTLVWEPNFDRGKLPIYM